MPQGSATNKPRPPRPSRPNRPNRPNRPWNGNGNNNTNNGSSNGSSDTTPPSPPAVPEFANYISRPSFTNPVKPATPDVILFDDATDIDKVEELADLFFQEIGGRELINLTNKDIINSINPNVGQIGNMFKINLQYNAQNLVPLFDPGNEIINRFSIKLNDYVPEPGEGTGPGGATIYIDDNGDLIINLINAVNNEKVEIQILNGGAVFNDTIYTEETA